MALTNPAKFKDQRICLVCQKETSFSTCKGFSDPSGNEAEDSELPQHKYIFYGSNDHFGLNQQLWNVFIARKLLHLTQEQCEQFLQFVETNKQNQSNPHPSEWFVFCEVCSVILEDAWIVYKAILRLNKELDKVSTQLRYKIIENCKLADAENNANNKMGIESKIWNILLTSCGEYVVKEEIPDSAEDKEVGAESHKLIDDPFFSTPHDRLTFPENEVIAPIQTGTEDTTIPKFDQKQAVKIRNDLENAVNQNIGPVLEIHLESSYVVETNIKKHVNTDSNEKGIERNDPDYKPKSNLEKKRKGRRPKDNSSEVVTLCEICSKEYSTSYSLRLHQQIAHSEGKYAVQCESCGKNFVHSHYLKIHYRSCKKLGTDGETRKLKKSKKSSSASSEKEAAVPKKRRGSKKGSSSQEKTDKPKIPKRRGRKPKAEKTQPQEFDEMERNEQTLTEPSNGDSLPVQNIQSHFLQTIQQMGFSRTAPNVNGFGVGETVGAFSPIAPSSMGYTYTGIYN